MKNILENIYPNVIDCQGILGGIFASLLMGMRDDVPDGTAPCYNDHRRDGKRPGELCTMCGNCGGKTLKGNMWFDLANEYAFVCGDVLLQFDMSKGVNRPWKDKPEMLAPYGDLIAHMFGYAGYTYRTYEPNAGKSDVFTAIAASIDAGIPVILRYEPAYMYLLITGYDDANMALYGHDGTGSCGFMQPAPDSHEGALFCASNWYESMGAAYIPGGKCAPSVTFEDVIARNRAIMRPFFEEGYYDRAVDYITDDANFKDEGGNLAVQAALINSFVDFPIGGRSAVSWYLFKRLADGCSEYREQFDRMSGACCDLHEISWVAWRGAGMFEENAPEIVKRLADPIYRKMLAGVVRLIGYKDRHIYEALCDMEKRHMHRYLSEQDTSSWEA